MSKYQKGQTFTFDRDHEFRFGQEILPHTETLTINKILEPETVKFGFKIDAVYEVSRHFKGDGVDTTNTVKLTERDIDNITSDI